MQNAFSSETVAFKAHFIFKWLTRADDIFKGTSSSLLYRQVALKFVCVDFLFSADRTFRFDNFVHQRKMISL